MNHFSYSVIVPLIVSSSISIFFTLITSQIWNRLLRAFIPAIFNISIIILLSFLEFSSNPEHYTFKIISETLFYPLLIAIGSSLFFGLLIFFTQKEIFSQKELEKFYLKFTTELKSAGTVRIIGGDLNFFGTCICDNICKTKIKENEYTSCIKCCRKKNCVLKSRQYRQLLDTYKDSRCNLEILCMKPQRTTQQNGINKDILIIGKLLNDFPGKIKIGCYDVNCPNLPIRGRVITTHGSDKMICYHWKIKKGYFKKPKILIDNNPEGKTNINFLELHWKKATMLTKKECNEYKSEYLNYISEEV